MKHTAQYFPAAIIAEATGKDKKTIHRHATGKGWPMRLQGNFFEYQVPAKIHAACLAIHQRGQPGLRSFVIGITQRAEIVRAQARFAMLCALDAELRRYPHEAALNRIAKAFHVSKVSLRVWAENFTLRGLAGLLENKRGKSGKWQRKGTSKPAARIANDCSATDSRNALQGAFPPPLASKSEGDQFKKARKRLGLTLQDLVAKTGYSLSTISRVENGHDAPSKRLRAALNKHLQLSQPKENLN